MNIITDKTLLNNAAEPLKFVTENGIEREEGDQIMAALNAVMQQCPDIIALAAPQIGINKRIFCIRFNDQIKFFINPIIKQKKDYALTIETNCSFKNKEFLLMRPKEITAVYYTNDYKFEDNKFLSPIAAIFDQQYNILDGVLPEDLGLVSDIEIDGSLQNLTSEEFNQVAEIYKQFIKIKKDALETEIKNDTDLQKEYKSLRFTESVVNGRANIIDNSKSNLNRAQRRAIKFKKGAGK